MSGQSAFAGSDGTQDFHIGTSSWTDPGDATGGPDGNSATIQPAHSTSSDSLDLWGWDFAIPPGSTVNGVSASITAERTGPAGTVQFSPNIGIVCGALVGAFTTNSLSGTTIVGGSFNTYTTGSSTDLAGLSAELTPTNVNSNVENVGITLGIEVTNATNTIGTANIDACQCTVFFTAGSPPPIARSVIVSCAVTGAL
jgi:hypothetical protein